MTSLPRISGQAESGRLKQIAGEPYYPRYREWLVQRGGARGYEFGSRPRTVPPPTMTGDAPPRWYALDRRARLLRERALRDRLLHDVLSLGRQSSSLSRHPLAEARMKAIPPQKDEGLSCLAFSGVSGTVSESPSAIMPR